ncbi:MAG: FAD-binding protein [Waddliaceae bacterium]|nr:FAD-binding protein [Waddliaceae bacterium]
MKKILVVGSGIAGPALCYWLKKYGFSPSLVEKHKSIRSGGYAIDIRGVAVDLARKMGIYDKVVANRKITKQGLHVDSEGKTILEVDGEEFGFRQDDDVEIIRGDLVHILMEAIPDVPCRLDMSIDSIIDDGDEVLVTFKDGTKESYDLLVGADGMHSSVRRAVFPKDSYKIRDLNHYISVFNVPNYLNLDQNELIYESEERSLSVYSPKDSNQSLVGLMFSSKLGTCDSRDPAEQKAFLKKLFWDIGWESNKLLQLMDASDGFYFDSIAQVIAPSWSKGRITLVGDAGYCASPLSGQGTSLALVGAYILAGELKQTQGDYSAFKHYEDELRPFVDANQSFGLWVSEIYLSEEELSGEAAAERSRMILERIKEVANAIVLKSYD